MNELMKWKQIAELEGNWEREFPDHLCFPKSLFGYVPYLKIGNPFRSIGVFGGAGSGKTESIFKPIIKQVVDRQAGVILYDYKNPELGNFLKAQNPKLPVYHVDFDNPETSAKINPIAPKYIKNTLSALELAQSLYFNLNPKAISGSKDPFWDNSAISILQATIWFLKENSPEQCNIPTLVEMLLRPIKDVLELLSEDDKCRKILASVLGGLESPNLLASISSTVQNPLSQLIEDDITTIMGSDETPLDVNNPESPSILILGINKENPKAISPLISLIITTALRVMNKPNKKESYIILDEGPTVYIPRIEEYPAVTRSNLISFVYGAQDISQIDKAYGKEIRQALLSNLGTQFFGRTPNNDTIKYIVELYGKRDKKFKSESQSYNHSDSSNPSGGGSSDSMGHSTSISVQQRDNITPQEILNFRPGQFAFIGTDVPDGQSTTIVVSLSRFGSFGELMTEEELIEKNKPFIKKKRRKISINWTVGKVVFMMVIIWVVIFIIAYKLGFFE